MNINNKEDIKNAKKHIEWLLDNEIFDNEDELYIVFILEYIQKLEREVKAYKYSKVPYLKGYIKGLEKGIEKLKQEDELWKFTPYEDYMYSFGLGYDMEKKSKLDINTGGNNE